jgi:hypothetical protein
MVRSQLDEGSHKVSKPEASMSLPFRTVVQPLDFRKQCQEAYSSYEQCMFVSSPLSGTFSNNNCFNSGMNIQGFTNFISNNNIENLAVISNK